MVSQLEDSDLNYTLMGGMKYIINLVKFLWAIGNVLMIYLISRFIISIFNKKK